MLLICELRNKNENKEQNEKKTNKQQQNMAKSG